MASASDPIVYMCWNCYCPIKGRTTQMVRCSICSNYVHRKCIPGATAASIKKNCKELENFKCKPCMERLDMEPAAATDNNENVASMTSEEDVAPQEGSEQGRRGNQRGTGRGVTRGSGRGVTRGAGRGVTRGSGRGVIRGTGRGVPRGTGRGVTRGTGAESAVVAPEREIATIVDANRLQLLCQPVMASSPMDGPLLTLEITRHLMEQGNLISPIEAGIVGNQAAIVFPVVCSNDSGQFNRAAGSQLAEWSSRYDHQPPPREVTIELRRKAAQTIREISMQTSIASQGTKEPKWHTYICGNLQSLQLFDGLGHSYGIKKKTSRTTTWRCCGRTKQKGCGALVSQRNGEFIPGKVAHTCIVKLDISFKKKIIADSKKKGKEERFISARRVVKPIMQQNFDEEPEKELPKMGNVIRAVRRDRGKNIPANPTDFHFDWETYSPFVDGGFYRGDVIVETPGTYARHLIFSTDRQLELLRKAQRWYGDATFGITPTPWYQVYSIHAFIRYGELETQVPLVFVLMARKRACDYRAVFEKIFDLLKVNGQQPAITEFVMDFECAVWQVLKNLMPNVKLLGCGFHITQAKFKHLKQLGLGPLYRSNLLVKTTCRKLLCLNLLPAEKIRKRFSKIKEEVELLRNVGNLYDFCLYIEAQWINSSVWPPENWSMFLQVRRTNNHVEGFHNWLKQLVNSTAPNLIKVIDILRGEADSIDMQAKLLSQKEVLSIQSKNTANMQYHLSRLWQSYEDHTLYSEELLEQIAELYANHNQENFKILEDDEIEPQPTPESP